MSENTRVTEFAHRSPAGGNVSLFWMQGDWKDEEVVCCPQHVRGRVLRVAHSGRSGSCWDTLVTFVRRLVNPLGCRSMRATAFVPHAQSTTSAREQRA
jgi:hypothetical protein